MKATNKDEWVPRALREVWEWKDSINQEVNHLPQREALREILRMAHQVAVEERFCRRYAAGGQGRRDTGPVPVGTPTDQDQENLAARPATVRGAPAATA